MNRYKIILLLIWIPLFLTAQENEVTWMDQYSVNLLFQLNQEEIPELLSGYKEDKEMHKYLHTPIDSRKNPGHYLKAEINKNMVTYTHYQIVPFRVYLFQEYGSLTFQVTDTSGNIHDDAEIQMYSPKSKTYQPIPYDKKTHTYRLKPDTKGRLEYIKISLNGFDAWYAVDHLYHTRHWRYDQRGNSLPQFFSYMLTDKNKYKPGETVRFKSYILSGDKKPLTDSLQVWLYSYRKSVRIKNIPAYHAGGYADEVFLHDSLNLRLNNDYYIQLKTAEGRIITSSNFQYEDYELSKTELKAKLHTTNHTSWDENKIDISLTDANGLSIPGTTATVTILPNYISYAHLPLLSVPDTLLHTEISLEEMKTTTFTIPGHIFPEADMYYDVKVKVETHDNFTETASCHARYHYQPDFAPGEIHIWKDLKINCNSGYLEIVYTENDIPLACEAFLSEDNQESRKITLPHKEPVNFQAKKYEVEIPEKKMKNYFEVRYMSTGFDIKSRHLDDKIEIELVNPHGFDVSWYVYNGDKLLDRGFGKKLQGLFPVTDPNSVHTVELFYLLGDEERSFRRNINPHQKTFTIEHNLPDRIYPGQNIDATILVTDEKGKPVEGVDLTAFAYNSMLEYDVPDLHISEKSPTHRPYLNSFKKMPTIYQQSKWLDYSFWKTVASLDTMEYFHFIYPRHEIYTHTINTPDNNTQFSPFIVWKGEFYQPHIIECDGVPVWFSWTEYPSVYSFHITPDVPHTIRLYAGQVEIILNDVIFTNGKKTILSVDPQYLPDTTENDISFSMKSLVLAEEQKERYKPYISRMSLDIPSYNAYLRQGDKYYSFSYNYRSGTIPSLSGPFLQGRTSFSDKFSFRLEGGYHYIFDKDKVIKEPDSTFFNSKRPYYCYTNHEKVKNDMEATCMTTPGSEPRNTYLFTEQPYFTDEILIEKRSPDLQIKITLPEGKEQNGVRRLFLYNKDKRPEEYSYLSDFKYRFNESVQEWQIPASYALFIIYNDGSYLFKDEIQLQENHRFYLKFKDKDIIPADILSERLLSFSYREHEDVDIYIPPFYIEEEEIMQDAVFTVVEHTPPYDSEESLSETENREQAIYEEIKQLQRLRSNFSDVAFWQPRLITDKEGLVRFPVTFPDNITQWNSIIYAMNPTLATGTARQHIRSFNPIMAELPVPRFLTTGDYSLLNSSLRNYTNEATIQGKSRFVFMGDSLPETAVTVSGIHREEHPITIAGTDSVTVAYHFRRDDGYFDGEQHTIPVVEQGVEITDGFSELLKTGEPFTIRANENESLHIKFTNSEMDIYLNAMHYLIGYEYACNEQLASKLKGILNYRLYMLAQDSTFIYDKEVNAIIGRLVNNQHSNGLWSWWGNSSQYSGWMSGHIMEALQEARKAGYQFELPYRPNISGSRMNVHNIAWLYILPHLYPNTPEFQKLPEQLGILASSEKSISLKDRLLIYELQQEYSDNWNPEVILPYLKKHPSGTVYCTDGSRNSWYNDILISTATACRIIQREPSLASYIEPMRSYLVSNQRKRWNTYQAATILSAVLSSFIDEDKNIQEQNSVIIRGAINKEITIFPYELTLQPGEEIELIKQGASSLVCTASSQRRTTTSTPSEEFTVTTQLSKEVLTTGEAVTLHVHVTVNSPEAEHVMIEVPIPAGCSYEHTNRNYSYKETYREYFKEKTVIFANHLSGGEHHYTIRLLPRYKGEYHMNPAKVSLMYFPHVCATNEIKKVTIE